MKEEKLKLMEKYVQFCMAKSINYTKEQIKLQVSMMLNRYSFDSISSALDELFYETPFFPDASAIVNKIKSSALIGNDKSIATEKANDIIQIIHDNGFDCLAIKKKLGEKIFNAIGGSSVIKSYGHGNVQQNTLVAQMRDAIMPITSEVIPNKKLIQIGALKNERLIGN